MHHGSPRTGGGRDPPGPHSECRTRATRAASESRARADLGQAGGRVSARPRASTPGTSTPGTSGVCTCNMLDSLREESMLLCPEASPSCTMTRRRCCLRKGHIMRSLRVRPRRSRRRRDDQSAVSCRRARVLIMRSSCCAESTRVDSVNGHHPCCMLCGRVAACGLPANLV